MLTSQRRTASARAHTDCILFYMTVEDFEEVIKNYPKYYDYILDKAHTDDPSSLHVRGINARGAVNRSTLNPNQQQHTQQPMLACDVNVMLWRFNFIK